MDEQLDIALLLKRLRYLEEGLSVLLSTHQFDTIFLMEPQTINDACTLRKKYFVRLSLEQKRNK